MKISKKQFVLTALFVFPLLFFLILSTGINNFSKLPTLTKNVILDELESNHSISFKDHISVLCFLGDNIEQKKGGFFNLNQKIYKEFYGYRPFQIIAVYPKEYQNDAINLKSKLGAFTDMSKWKFISMDTNEIRLLHKNLQINDSLDTSLYSKKAYLLDKELNLRGRNNDKDYDNGIMFGYNIESVAELNNKMEDDIKVLLYEYRAAFKNKNKASRKN
ncbi:MAG: Uncharacterised protein [Flavobacterium sp. SCGC AAA160-P02]|nr:MAG: Uncharacterised protein [Flavobacterium sp. SCGC AAA160-P02]